MSFEILHTDGPARIGKLRTAHGSVETPFFMPVGSKGSVKAMLGGQLEDLGFESVIMNSFILSIVPGIDVIEAVGGLHNFTQFKKTIFTDSGGFQVLSKDFLVKKSDEGAVFRDSHGKRQLYTPEVAVENQLRIGSDVAMTLDDVAHHGMDGKTYVDAIKRTHDWAKRSIVHHKLLSENYGSGKEKDRQLLFGIAQGGIAKEYRRFSTYKINEMDFDGYALGGLVIGESRGELMDAVKLSVEHFKVDKVRYLMGLGSPPDIIRAIGMGVDCFDSIYPTSNARHGSMLTRKGRIAIKKRIFKMDSGPIDPHCTCMVCKKYSRAFLHHMLRTHELQGYTLATIHNLHFMKQMIAEAKQAIKEERYNEFAYNFLLEYFSGKENKEFSNHIKLKYLEQLKPNGKVHLLEYNQ
jgi:queuine tRNA-ribosyltransferase